MKRKFLGTKRNEKKRILILPKQNLGEQLWFTKQNKKIDNRPIGRNISRNETKHGRTLYFGLQNETKTTIIG